jgi:hypothetical protein
LSPAFPTSQNLMTDVPTLFFWLMFFVFVFRFELTEKQFDLIKAGLFSALACLTKYIGAVLLPILVLVVLIKQKKGLLLILLAPFVLLFSWGIISYLDYGTVHLFSKIRMPKADKVLLKACDYMVCLGGICPFSLLFFPAFVKDKKALLLILFSLLPAYYFFPANFLRPGEVTLSLIYYFWLNGIFTFLSTLYFLCRLMTKSSPKHFLKLSSFVFFCWFIGIFLFVILFVPFVAVRHLLPIIPVIVIVLGLVAVPKTSLFFRNLVFALSMTLAIVIAISDWSLANVYRDMASQIRKELGKEARIIAFGHWGWQWYAEKEGMIIFDRYSTTMELGDYVVIPSSIHVQRINKNEQSELEVIRIINVVSPLVSWIRTMGRKPVGGYYYSVRLVGPWRFSNDPLETFTIYQKQRNL